MIIRKIQIDNYLCYYDTNTFELSEGLNIILGENGEGKTKFFESVDWLFNGENRELDMLVSAKKLDETEIGGGQIHKKTHILSATPEQLELVSASGVLGRCKIIKPKNINPASKNKQESSKSPLLKELLGKWEMAGNGWTFEYKTNGIGEISHKGSQVYGKFSYSVKDNLLSESNFSGTCKIAGGTDSASLYAIEISGDSMTMKHSNGHVTSWTKITP